LVPIWQNEAKLVRRINPTVFARNPIGVRN
jgi:hypothetical protein